MSIGFVVDLEYADATTSAHDLLQLFKTHPWCAGSSRAASASPGGRRRCPGAATGRCPSFTPRAADRRRRAGMVDTVALKGVHHCLLGNPRGEAIYAALKRGEPIRSSYAEASRSSLDRQGAVPGAQHPPALPARLHQGGPIVNAMIAHQGPLSQRALALASQRREAAVHRRHTKSYPKPDDKYTFDKLSRCSSPATPPATTPPTTSACARTCRARSPRRGAGCARPASTRSPTTPPRRQCRRDGQLHKLRAVWGDHRQGGTAHRARGGRRSAVPVDLTSWSGPTGANKGARAAR